jgi:DNA-binding CsgD family transcriptional regulator
MEKNIRLIRISSAVLVGAGVLTLLLNWLLERTLNIALPLVFLMFGAAFYILVSALSHKYSWAVWLYIPSSLLLALGLVFLLNVITNDWNAWAYAWLLLLAGGGFGVLLVNRRRPQRQEVLLTGWGLTAGGLTLFVLFGAIAGGKFIQVMAPVLLVLGGLALWGLKPETFLRREKGLDVGIGSHSVTGGGGVEPHPTTALVEPLSRREIEVLYLIDQGLSNAEIAALLTLAPSTVKTHINNIYGKLGVQTRVQALKRARELGLLQT